MWLSRGSLTLTMMFELMHMRSMEKAYANIIDELGHKG